MATHSSILAWRIPWTEEPGGLQSTEWQRIRQDCGDLARTGILPHFLVFALTTLSCSENLSPEHHRAAFFSSLNFPSYILCVSYVSRNCLFKISLHLTVCPSYLEHGPAHSKCSDIGMQSPANSAVFAKVSQWVLLLFFLHLLLPLLFLFLFFLLFLLFRQI